MSNNNDVHFEMWEKWKRLIRPILLRHLDNEGDSIGDVSWDDLESKCLGDCWTNYIETGVDPSPRIEEIIRRDIVDAYRRQNRKKRQLSEERPETIPILKRGEPCEEARGREKTPLEIVIMNEDESSKREEEKKQWRKIRKALRLMRESNPVEVLIINRFLDDPGATCAEIAESLNKERNSGGKEWDAQRVRRQKDRGLRSIQKLESQGLLSAGEVAYLLGLFGAAAGTQAAPPLNGAVLSKVLCAAMLVCGLVMSTLVPFLPAKVAHAASPTNPEVARAFSAAPVGGTEEALELPVCDECEFAADWIAPAVSVADGATGIPIPAGWLLRSCESWKMACDGVAP